MKLTGREKYEYAMIHLIKTRPFYAHLVMNMRVSFGDKVPTAGVNITDKINLYINPKFFEDKTIEFVADVLEHECLHVMNNHFERIINHTEHKVFANLVTDCAINQYLKNLGKGGDYITPEVLEKIYKKKPGSLKKFEASEYYYNECVQEHQKQKDQFSKALQDAIDKGMLDDHSIWEEGSQSETHNKAVIQEAVGKAVEQAGGIGHVSSDIALLISKLNKNTVNWKTLLKNFVFRNVISKKKPTRKRPNRRFGLAVPGFKKERVMSLAICMDTSGSVSDKALAQFYSEVVNIHKTVPNLHIIEADSEVKEVKKYNPKTAITVKGRGGTAYQPAITKAMELGVDAIIYFGDMDASDKPTDPRIPFLWAVVGNQKPPGNFGLVVKVEVKE